MPSQPRPWGGGGNFLTTKEIDGVIKVVDTDISLEDVIQTVTVGQTTTGEPGTNASVSNSGTSTAPVFNFTIPRGQDGQDGEDAINPFKGWWNDAATLINSITAARGDYAYVVNSGSSPLTASIYKYDSTETTNNYWGDSGVDFNPVNNQEFMTGQLLNTVNIVDNMRQGGINDVLSSAQGKLIGSVFYKEVSNYEAFDGTWSTDGTFQNQYGPTNVYPIPDASFDYLVDFRAITTNLPSTPSIVYLDENNDVVGYDNSYHASPTYNISNVKLTNLPGATKKIGLWVGSSGEGASALFYANTKVTYSDIVNVTNDYIIGTKSTFVEVQPFKKVHDKWLKNDGTLQSYPTPQPTAYIGFYYVDPNINYTVDVKIGYRGGAGTYNDSCALCYYDEKGTFLSYEIDPRLSTNLANGYFNYKLTIPSNAAIVALYGAVDSEPRRAILRQYFHPSKFFGKKIAIIGDSIPSFGKNTNPYMRITPSMVGTTIQSYVTFYDVHNQDSGTTGKKIGGITLTDAMNDGQLHSFTPTSDDIGKEIGVPKYYAGNESTRTWPYYMCQYIGARIIGNASYSASGVTTAREGLGNYEKFSAMWRDYTIGRCREYNISGILEYPDIVIISRGVNDFSRTNSSTDSLGDLTLDNPDLSNGFDASTMTTDVENGSFQFKKAYYATIQKLRKTYPNAIVVCSTINVTRGMTNNWPTRNNKYLLSDISNAIREIADTMGCPVIEFDKDNITWENCISEGYLNNDGTHPLTLGHQVMGLKAAQDIQKIGL